MTIDQFEKLVANTLLITQWMWVGNEGEHQVEFTDTHLLLQSKVLPYTLCYDRAKVKLVLNIFHEDSDKILAILCYDRKNQRWFGRVFNSVGYIQITPISEIDTWKVFSNPTNVMNGQVPAKALPINYIDEIPIDYNVPAFNILDQFSVAPHQYAGHICIALAACERLRYFKQCVQALAQNPEFITTTVVLFLDKPTDISQVVDNQEHIKVLQKVHPKPLIIERPCNFGPGRNIIDIRRQLFDNLGFERVYIIEDDVIVAANYLEVMNNLWKWVLDNNYENNVGVVQGWQYTLDTQPSCYVDVNMDNLWAYSMSLQCWNDIKDLVYQYERDYLFCRYNERPHRTIFKWYEQIPVVPTREGYPVSTDKKVVLKGSLNSLTTTQESCVLKALYTRGWLRISPNINLAENIGRSGVGKVEDYDNMKYADVKIQQYATPEQFEEAL